MLVRMQVTCGSVIKVQHSATGALLHSHDITYGSGSGQQSVTGFAGGDDASSYWIVRGTEVSRSPLGSGIQMPSTNLCSATYQIRDD